MSPVRWSVSETHCLKHEHTLTVCAHRLPRRSSHFGHRLQYHHPSSSFASTYSSQGWSRTGTPFSRDLYRRRLRAVQRPGFNLVGDSGLPRETATPSTKGRQGNAMHQTPSLPRYSDRRCQVPQRLFSQEQALGEYLGPHIRRVRADAL